MTKTVYTYPAAYERDIAAARRRYGALAEDMPPVVIKFLLNVFGSAWPVERRGACWTVTTPLQHIEIETSSPAGRAAARLVGAGEPGYRQPVHRQADRVHGRCAVRRKRRRGNREQGTGNRGDGVGR